MKQLHNVPRERGKKLPGILSEAISEEFLKSAVRLENLHSLHIFNLLIIIVICFNLLVMLGRLWTLIAFKYEINNFKEVSLQDRHNSLCVI